MSHDITTNHTTAGYNVFLKLGRIFSMLICLVPESALVRLQDWQMPAWRTVAKSLSPLNAARVRNCLVNFPIGGFMRKINCYTEIVNFNK